MAAGITTFLDPAQLPGRTQEQKTFDTAVAYVMQNWPTWGAEVNATWAAFNAALASVNAIAAGGAYALPYTFDSATADADPGAGKLRLSSTTQNASTTLRLDVLANGQDVSSILDAFDASTSTVKGSIRLVKLGDATRWLTFDVTARAVPTGYRNITVANTGGSSASPFVAGDAVMLFFQRNGDKGSIGQPGFSNMIVLRSTQGWTPPAGVTKAKFTVIDGAWGGGVKNGGSTAITGGRGADASVSIRTVSSSVTYACTIGAGGVAPGNSTSGFDRAAVAGGASSVSGSGFTTLTTAAGDIVVPGWNYNDQMGGGSLYAPTQRAGGPGLAIGQGSSSSTGFSAGYPGSDGAIIIEY